MGMDLVPNSRKNDSDDDGFHRNWWGWRALWDYCERLVPGISERAGYEGHNDGHVSAEDAVALASAIRIACQSGEAARYIESRRMEIMTKSPKSFEQLMGDPDALNQRVFEKTSRPLYDFTVADLEELAEFCDRSGGFEFC